MPVTKVCVVGNTASGKSYLAGLVGREFGLPVTHLDVIYWQPGWGHITRDEFLSKQREITAQPAWVIDGCFSEFGLAQRFQAADVVVFLDMPTWSCLRRAIGRRGDSRADLAADDKKLPLGLALAFLAEICLFKLLERPRILATARNAGAHFIRIRKWADEPAALLGLKTV